MAQVLGTTKTRSKANVGMWTLQVLVAAVFIGSGLAKVFGETQTVESFNDIGFGDWFRYLIGALELLGAAALLIPRLCGLAGLAFVGLMVGAIVFSLAFFEPATVVTPAVVLVPVAVIAWARRDRTARLFQR